MKGIRPNIKTADGKRKQFMNRVIHTTGVFLLAFFLFGCNDFYHDLEPSDENRITSFKIDGQIGKADIGNNTISVRVQEGTDITNVIPRISVSPGATLLNIPKDFSVPVDFLVMSGKGTVRKYTAIVTITGDGVIDPPLAATFYVSNTDEWNAAVKTISGGGDNKGYIINITGDFSVEGHGTATFGNVSVVKVTIQGPGRTMSLSGNGNMLYIGSNQSVVLREVTLQGHGSNNASLVCVYLGIFTVESGEISGNTTNLFGGGVNVYNGTFTMNGGEISGNTTPYDGAGVFVHTNGTFTMHGGKISGNTVYNPSGGGGVYVVGNGTFTMHGGEISGNTVNKFCSGGGVYVRDDGTFTMHGGKISGNTASYGGGGVYVGNDGTFTMHGGEISGNTTSGCGGGVEVDSGTFTMNGGEISGNTAYVGGGVFVDQWGNGTFRIVNGTIYGSEAAMGIRNIAHEMGAALRNDGAAEYGTFSGSTWNSNGTLFPLSGFSFSFFDYTIRVVNGELLGLTPMPDNHVFNVATTAQWNSALSSIAAYGGNKNYTINVTADFSVEGRGPDSECRLSNTPDFGIASGVTVTLQGPGRTLTLSDKGNILRIGSNQSVILRNLTLRGHSSNNSSLVHVEDGTFTMESGEISGNTAGYVMGGGGGVSVGEGTFTMNDGKISGNTSCEGGGVSVWGTFGTFIMNGGEISGNTANVAGGGVVILSAQSFTMNGGVISGNTTNLSGGGVFVGNTTFTMHGGEISGNTAYDGGGVFGTFRIVTGTIYGSNEADTGLRNNTAGAGAALYTNGIAQHGTFSGSTWNSKGNLVTTDKTIKVLNGVLQP